MSPFRKTSGNFAAGSPDLRKCLKEMAASVSTLSKNCIAKCRWFCSRIPDKGSPSSRKSPR